MPPIGLSPTIRLFDILTDTHGEQSLTYRYANPTDVHGPNSEVRIPEMASSLDFDLRVVGAVRETGESVIQSEAPGFVLGYSLLMTFKAVDLLDDRPDYAPADDLASVIGPFVVTPEDLTEFTVGSDPTQFAFNYTIKVNEEVIARNSIEAEVPFSQMLEFASKVRRVHSADVLAWPKLEKPSTEVSSLGRGVLPGDRIEATVDGFGTLVARVS